MAKGIKSKIKNKSVPGKGEKRQKKSRLTPGAINILKALVNYQYLTGSLVELSGIATKRTARDSLFPQLLAANNKKGLIVGRRFGNVGHNGSVETAYCLNHAGAKFLAKLWGIEISGISYPQKGLQIAQSYSHCMALISFHIQLTRWIEQSNAQLLAFDRYFNRVPHPDENKSDSVSAAMVFHQEGHITPDAIFKYKTLKGERVSTVEIQFNDPVGKIITQYEKYIPVFRNKSISRYYGYDKCPFVLSIFNDAKSLKQAKKWFLSSDILKPALNGFIFNTLKQIKQDIRQGWHLADNQEVTFFD